MKHHDLKFLWTTHFQSFTWDNHPKMNLQHKTKETDIQFFVFIPNTNIDVRDEIQFEKLGSEHSFCHIVFDLEYKGKTRITLFQIILVNDLLIDERKFRPVSPTTDIKFFTPLLKILESGFSYLNTINDLNGFATFTNSKDKLNNHFHICFI